MTLNKKKLSKFLISIILFSFAHATQAKDTSLITGDIGGSTTNNNGKTYQEAHLGINVNFTDWLTWRNAGFKRTGSNIKEITGLDSTLRLIMRAKVGSNGSFHLFAGPGYRWTSEEINNAALAEAGMGFNMGGVGFSAGAKYLKYDKPRKNNLDEDLDDAETSYFVSLNGNASFGK